MLDQYFSKMEDQERMKATLREIVGDEYGGMILIFRGKGATGKTMFTIALKNALKQVSNIRVVDVVREENGYKPKLASIKGKNDEVFLHETNTPGLFQTNDFGLARRVQEFHFDQTFTRSDKKDDQIVEELEFYLRSIMEDIKLKKALPPLGANWKPCTAEDIFAIMGGDGDRYHQIMKN